MKNLIILKLGGSVITEKDLSEPKINRENLNRLSSEIAKAYFEESMKLIIVHGAGSFGHPIVKRTGIHEGITHPDQVFSFAQTQLLQNKLNSAVCEILQYHKLPVIPFQPSASAIMKDKRLISINDELIISMVELSLIPVLFGVPAFDKGQKCSILSGDQIIVHLANVLKPQKIIFTTNVDGILGKDQEVIEKITKNNFEEIKENFYQAKYDDVTGSMAGKISELLTLSGIKSHIINGNTKDILYNILKGKEVRGTIIEF